MTTVHLLPPSTPTVGNLAPRRPDLRRPSRRTTRATRRLAGLRKLLVCTGHRRLPPRLRTRSLAPLPPLHGSNEPLTSCASHSEADAAFYPQLCHPLDACRNPIHLETDSAGPCLRTHAEPYPMWIRDTRKIPLPLEKALRRTPTNLTIKVSRYKSTSESHRTPAH